LGGPRRKIGRCRSVEAFFSVSANVAEEQIAEDDVGNAVSERRRRLP